MKAIIVNVPNKHEKELKKVFKELGLKSSVLSAEFKAVDFMRDTRDSLTKKYLKDPTAETRDLARIRRKYKLSVRKKKKIA